MKRLAGFGVVIGTVIAVRVAGTSPTGSSGTTLALGSALLGAWVAGELLRRFHIPRVTGFLLFGIVAGPYVSNVIDRVMVAQLQMVSGTATTLIALIAGMTFNVERLRDRLAIISRLTAATLGLTLLALVALLALLWPWLPVAREAEGMDKAVMIGLLAVILVSVSPTMTAAVAAEMGVRNRLSELVLAVVLIADLIVLVLFSFGLQIARFRLGSPSDVSVLVQLAWEVGGAIATGVLLGAVFALYLRFIAREVVLALIVLCLVLGQAGSVQQFEPLLAAVAAGLTIENLAAAQGDALRAAVQQSALPVLVIFFVSIGASLRLDALAVMGPAALVLAFARIVFIRFGVRAGTVWSGADPAVTRYAWTGLISQAGITLGFATVLAQAFPGWGAQVQLLVVALIPLHELVGPLLFRHGLAQTSELDATAERPLIVVSNREPYIHRHTHDDVIAETRATGGVAVALDALLRERGGIWIAHGSGSADRLVVDAEDKVRVPMSAPAFQLRRLWLEEPTFSAYYAGFANEGLWPLCHLVDVRPQFRIEDWLAYQDVNERFAHAIEEELTAATTPIFIQDYHLALVAPALRRRRPHVRTALFWHIPWPHPDRFRICPWRRELIDGLLGNDLLAFQLERDRRNFLLAIEEDGDIRLELDLEASSVRTNSHTCSVVAVPIGVDFDRIQALAASDDMLLEQDRLGAEYDLRAPILGIGVDRLDYTKGILERLAALDEVVSQRPQLRGRLSFLQIGIPSRSEVDAYAKLEGEIDHAVAALNARHALPGAPPLICYQKRPLTLPSLVALYQMAHFCVVSSLHDGMNLVAKEFVAARDDETGVLVLSALAGAAQELKEALVINPYDIHGFAQAILTAIEMPESEQRARMRALRRTVAGRNVFVWASDILEGLESIWSKPLHYAVRNLEETTV